MSSNIYYITILIVSNESTLASSLFLGYTLVSCTLVFLSLVLKRGFFTEVFHKLTAIAFGLIFMILVHFSVLSRISFYWYQSEY